MKHCELKGAILLAGLLVGGSSLAGAVGTFSAVFAPVAVPLNGTSTLTYTLTSFDNLRNLGFNATLPGGLVVANPNGVTNNCGAPPAVPGPTITAVPGAASVQVASANTTNVYDGPLQGIRSYGCVISFNVQGTTVGSKTVTPTLTSNGNNSGLTAPATLSVTAAIAAAASIPTLSEWGLLLLMAAMGLSA
ncbi:MAG: IPTL-CTERM sorting domain-containing protein, partial [Comamonadaceae bacterium]